MPEKLAIWKIILIKFEIDNFVDIMMNMKEALYCLFYFGVNFKLAANLNLTNCSLFFITPILLY